MAHWSRENTDKIERALPLRRPRGNGGISDVQAHSGIAAMGAVILAASAMGVKSRGRSGFFQTAFLAFGLHSLTHLGASALFRGYTPGTITAPIVVLPYWLWGWRKLNVAGVLRNDPVFWATAAVAVPVTIGGAHLAAAGLLKARELTSGRRAARFASGDGDLGGP
jgi:hypothetical protein